MVIGLFVAVKGASDFSSYVILTDGSPWRVGFQLLQLLLQFHLHLQQFVVLLRREREILREGGRSSSLLARAHWVHVRNKSSCCRKKRAESETEARRGRRKKNSSHSRQYHLPTHKAAAADAGDPNVLAWQQKKKKKLKRKEYPATAVTPAVP